MNPSFLYPDGENLKDQSDEHPPEPVHSMNEGSEFLDDAIRMKDLPLMSIEQKIDAGRTRILF